MTIYKFNNYIINISKKLGQYYTTNYKYIYNPYITPNYSYSYIDDNDIFNLLLRVNKTFNQDNYCIDLTNTYLYNILGLGDNLNGLEKLTQNDTIGIKGYIKNNNLSSYLIDNDGLINFINNQSYNFKQLKTSTFCSKKHRKEHLHLSISRIHFILLQTPSIDIIYE